MANFNFNKVILGGRLTATPELKTTPTGKTVTTFSVAVNRKTAGDGGEKADFLNVTAWKQTAEFITRYFRKGSSICVVGWIQTRSWTDQQGQKRFATEIVADEAYFVDAKSESPASVQRNSSVAETAPAQGGYMPDNYGYDVPAVPTGTQESMIKTPAWSASALETLGDEEELPF